jgi:hypothetical protein
MQQFWPDHDQQHCYHHAPMVKPEAATAIVELLMMGVRMPETCWALHKCQVISLGNCCIMLVDLLEFIIMFTPHHYHVHTPPPVHILSQINSVHTLSKIYHNIILPSIPRSSK